MDQRIKTITKYGHEDIFQLGCYMPYWWQKKRSIEQLLTVLQKIGIEASSNGKN